MQGDFQPDLTLLDALPQKAWVADADGTVWFVNRRAVDYLGRSSAWVHEHGWSAVLHPEDVPAADAAWQRSVATAEPYEVEFRLIRADGAYRWHVARSGALLDDEGTITGWLGTCTDVHDRHVANDQLEVARREVDEQLALVDALLEHAPIGMGLIDRDLRLVRANQALVEGSGKPLDQLVGRSVRELAPDVWDQLAPLLRRVLEGGETITDIELTAPHPEDPTREGHWVVGYYPITLDGEIIGAGALSQDVTAQLERTQELRSSEELRALAERAGSLGSWEYDLVTGRGRWSSGLRQVLEVAPDAVPSPEGFAARLHPDDRDRFRAEFGEALATGRVATHRYRLALPGGRERIVEARLASEVEDGRVVRIFGTTQDVTEWVRRAERIERAERLLTEAETVAELGSFDRPLPEGNTVLSPGYWRLLGLEPPDPDDEEVSPPPMELLRSYLHPDDRERSARSFQRLIETGQMAPDWIRLQLPGGTVRELELRGTVYRDADGVPRRLIGTALDVTARERLRREREELLERSLTAADHERRRIAEHLHDDAVQALTATLLRVDHAQATGSTEPLGRARATLESAVRSLRLNIMELAPVDLAADGFEAAVAAYAEQLLELDGVAVDLHVELGDEQRIASDRLLVSYQIIREALANVRRHAEASSVVIAVRREADAVVGEVTDDGVGVGDGDGTSQPGHLGTQLMRQRAELVGGEVTIAARPGAPGTTVTWRLPFPR